MSTTKLPEHPDAKCPMGADNRFIMGGEKCNMIQITVPAHQVNKATVHATVMEFCYVLKGHGEIWREYGAKSCITELVPGTSRIRIVLEGLRGEESIAALCRRQGIAESLYYNWSKEFLEAGKKRLAGDTARAATSDEVKQLRNEARDLKEVVAEQALELRLLKKSMIADGGDDA